MTASAHGSAVATGHAEIGAYGNWHVAQNPVDLNYTNGKKVIQQWSREWTI